MKPSTTTTTTVFEPKPCKFCPFCGAHLITKEWCWYRCEQCRMKWLEPMSDQMKALPKKKGK